MGTRERLITSMQALLWERGYVGTSPKAIQQRAGVGQGSMYHHFTGKPDLALAAIQRCAEQIQSFAQTRLSGPGTAFERIEAFLLQERKVLQGCQLGRLTADPEIVANPDLHRPVTETFDWLRQRLAGVLQGAYVMAKAAGSDEPYYSAVRGVLAMLAPQDKNTLHLVGVAARAAAFLTPENKKTGSCWP